MKKFNFLLKGIASSLCCLLLLSMQSCRKDTTNEANLSIAGKSALNQNRSMAVVSNADLIAYKNSSHELTAGFYRTWRDRTVSGNVNDPIMTSLPDSLDIAIVFTDYTPPGSPYWAALKNTYIPALHAKGTKVIVTGNLNIPSGVSHDAAGYAATAKMIMDSTINKYGYDGYDIDIESNPSGTTLTDMAGVYHALSAYLGPKSGTGKLLTFDTNQTGSNSLFRLVYSDISYVFLQAYGRGASTLQNTWNTFSPYISSGQFVVGFSFYEENGYPGNSWDDIIYPENGTGRAYDYARWEPTSGKKGGTFGYAIDRDAALISQHDNVIRTPNFKVTNDLIKIMNPVSGTGIISGANYKMISAINNSSVLDVYGSLTADGTKVELWSNNSPSSTNQQWKVTSISGGYYKLQPLNAPTKVLEVSGTGTANGTQVDIYSDNNTSQQKWQISDAGNGYYTLSPASAPASRLDVYASQTTNGTKIEIWSSGSGNNQKFKFVQQ